MKINRNIRICLFLLTMSVFTAACSKVKSDAQKAAKLANRSIEKTHQLKMDDAEKLYMKSQKIIEKYESHKKKEKFLELYQKYRDKNKINPPPLKE